MSRKLFVFLVSELQVMRVICQRPACRSVSEVSLDRARGKFTTAACPVCGHDILPPMSGPDNPITRLAKALEEVQALKASVEVEFILPDTTE